MTHVTYPGDGLIAGSRVLRATLLISLLGVLAVTAVARGQEPRLAAAWRVFPDAAARAAAKLAPDEVGLLREEVRRAGWIVPDHGLFTSSPGSLRRTGGELAVDLRAAALLIIPEEPDRIRASLDGAWGLSLLGDGRGGSVVLVPPGEHRVGVARSEVLANRLALWGAIFGGAVLVALAALGAHRLLARGDPRRGPRPAPVPRGRAGLLVLVVAAFWSWTLAIPFLAYDYTLAIVGRAQLLGELPLTPPPSEGAVAALFGGSAFFRPFHHALFALDTLPFDASPVFLHLTTLLWHLAAVLLLFVVLHRVAPAGAWWGALIAGIWPAPAQALAWASARALPLTFVFGALALLAAMRYLRSGSAVWLAAAAAALWLGCGIKESALAHLGLIVVLAPSLEAAWSRRRRVLALASTAGFVLAAVYALRQLVGLGMTRGYLGAAFRSPFHLLAEAAGNLPEIFKGALALSTTDAALGYPGWIGAALLALLAAAAGWRSLVFALGGCVCAAILSLPEATWPRGWAAPALARSLYPASMICWGVLAAGALAPGVRSARRRLALARTVLVLLVGTAAAGHLRERTWFTEMGAAAASWVREVSERIAAEDAACAASDTGLEGPAGLIVVGRPDPHFPGRGPVLGPAMAELMAPPFAARRWEGQSFDTVGAAQASAFLRRYPWRILELDAAGGSTPPTRLTVHRPISGTLPREVATRAEQDRPGVYGVDLGGLTAREIGVIGFTFARGLPAGTSLTLRDATAVPAAASLAATTLVADRAPGLTISLETTTIPGWGARGAAPALLIEVGGWAVDPGAPRVRVGDAVPELRIVAPRPPIIVSGGALPPPLVFEDPAGASRHVLALSPDPLGLRAGFLPLELPPRASGRTFDLEHHFGAAASQWRDRVWGAADRFPNFEGFWILLELRGVLGEPPWVQSRSVPLPVEVSFE